jgi:hypothetical protein
MEKYEMEAEALVRIYRGKPVIEVCKIFNTALIMAIGSVKDETDRNLIYNSAINVLEHHKKLR